MHWWHHALAHCIEHFYYIHFVCVRVCTHVYATAHIWCQKENC